MTKLPFLATALAALVAVAGAASAENAFDLDRAQSTASNLTLTNVQADRPGSLRVYAHDGDSFSGLGRLLGRAEIAAGATGDVAIALREPADERFVIVMMNSNHSVSKMNVREPLTN